MLDSSNFLAALVSSIRSNPRDALFMITDEEEANDALLGSVDVRSSLSNAARVESYWMPKTNSCRRKLSTASSLMYLIRLLVWRRLLFYCSCCSLIYFSMQCSRSSRVWWKSRVKLLLAVAVVFCCTLIRRDVETILESISYVRVFSATGTAEEVFSLFAWKNRLPKYTAEG